MQIVHVSVTSLMSPHQSVTTLFLSFSAIVFKVKPIRPIEAHDFYILPVSVAAITQEKINDQLCIIWVLRHTMKDKYC